MTGQWMRWALRLDVGLGVSEKTWATDLAALMRQGCLTRPQLASAASYNRD